MSERLKILGAAMGDCVHVAGLYNFLRLAEEQGYHTEFLGPAVELEQIVRAIREQRPDLVALGYRLTPESARRLLADLKRMLRDGGLDGVPMVFGGTPPVARVAEQSGLFEAVFDQTQGDEAVIAYLRGRSGNGPLGAGDLGPDAYPQTLVERVRAQAPHPIIRHHFGLPSLAETIAGVAELAEAKILDVISLGVDQNTQEHFFRPSEMDPREDGSGGVPVRTPDDFRRLYAASRRGNYPLLRSYSGTRDLLPMAELLRQTIDNAWGAIPLTWYSVLDGRSKRTLLETVREAQVLFAWHAHHGIPVESNESHHWSLRDAPDAVAVAMAFLAAYNAKQAGVSHYVAQYMFNTPPATSFAMDLAKMLAKAELIESLHDDRFTTLRETRAGLTSLPADLDVAKGHLATTTMLQMALRPQIIHVVAHCEADHAATPRDIIESVKIVRGAVRNAMRGMPDLTRDPAVQQRKEELLEDARVLLDAIGEIAHPSVDDPWADAATLARAVHAGLIDAPHLKNNPEAQGRVVTRMIGGACRAVDPVTGRPLNERERVARILDDWALGRTALAAAGGS